VALECSADIADGRQNPPPRSKCKENEASEITSGRRETEPFCDRRGQNDVGGSRRQPSLRNQQTKGEHDARPGAGAGRDLSVNNINDAIAENAELMVAVV